MTDSLKKQIQEKQGQEGFIKVTDGPISGLTAAQKAVLNRKGNELFNQGNIAGAQKIFRATGYSDGLSRIGDFYRGKNCPLDALKEYYLAHNRAKAEAIYESLAKAVQHMLHNDESCNG